MTRAERIETRNAAVRVVLTYGWQALGWPVVSRYFPRYIRRAADLAVALAVARGVRGALRG